MCVGEDMKAKDKLRRLLFCCYYVQGSPKNNVTGPVHRPGNAEATVKKRLCDLFKCQENQEEYFAIGAAATADNQLRRHFEIPQTSLVLGTIFGHRRGSVSFCVQSNPAVPPLFLFEISMPTQRLADEMASGNLRFALQCDLDPAGDRNYRHQLSTDDVWDAYCNGEKVGHAVKRQPTEKDCRLLDRLRPVSAGVGELSDGEFSDGDDINRLESVWRGEQLGKMIYMRASYERVKASRDSVSYQLIDPTASPGQELSVSVMRMGRGSQG